MNAIGISWDQRSCRNGLKRILRCDGRATRTALTCGRDDRVLFTDNWLPRARIAHKKKQTFRVLPDRYDASQYFAYSEAPTNMTVLVTAKLACTERHVSQIHRQ